MYVVVKSKGANAPSTMPMRGLARGNVRGDRDVAELGAESESANR